jgi:tRNA A-37 threonylcarbamoyl transferase component Bud32
LKRIDEPHEEAGDSGVDVEATDRSRNTSRCTADDCPPDQILLAATSGEADSLCLDALAEHLSRCDRCAQRIDTLFETMRPGVHTGEGHRYELEEIDTEHELIVSNLLETAAVRSRNPNRTELLGRYRLGRSIGHGSMGNVYEAVDIALGRTVAVKMLRAEMFSATALDRFELEARAQATLNHPNIVSLHEFGHHQGFPFLVMEYVSGGALSKVLRERPLASRKAASLMVPIASAVAHAHHKGLLHRDLKPSNILISLSPNGNPESDDSRDHPEIDGSIVPKIADFGLARILSEGSDLTRSDSLVGTVAYLAPERISNSATKAGTESDVYALGVILYECLTGRPPFQGEDAAKTIAMIQDLAPVPPSDLKPDVPLDLETICLKCLEKEPRHRYATADELADDLQRFLDDRPIKARPLGLAARTFRWCRRNTGAAAAIAVAMVSLTILSVAGWVAASIQADLTESVRVSELEARRQAQIAETSRQVEEKRRVMAMAQFMRGTTALDRFGILLEMQSKQAMNADTIEKLQDQFRAELVKLTDKFLSETESLGESLEILMQITSISAAAHARNGDLQRAEELYGKVEAYGSRIESNPEMFDKSRFFAMHAASAIGHAYTKAGRNGDTIRILSECMARWKFDIRKPKISPAVISMRHTLAFSLQRALQAESLTNHEELDQEVADLEKVISGLSRANP